MPDEQTGRDAQSSTSNTSATSGMQNGGAQDNPFASWPREDLERELRKLRDENTGRRLKEEELEKKAREADRTAAEAEKKRLAEAGEWEKLSMLKAAEAAKPFQEQALRYEQTISATNAQLIQQIPEQMRALIPEGLSVDQLNGWLIKSLPLLQRKPAPDTDAGAGQGGGPKQPAVTPEIQSMAGMAKDLGYNISPEALAKRKAEMAQQRRRTPEKDEE